MSALWRDARAYGTLCSLVMHMVWVYRFAVLFWAAVSLMQIYVLKAVWTAVYEARGGGAPGELSDLIAYLTLATLQLWFAFPITAEFIHDRVRSGTIAQDIARPLPFLNQMIAQQVGASAALAPFLVVLIPAGFILGGLAPPASVAAGAQYLASFTLAYLITMEVGLVFGLLAFWTTEAGAFMEIYQFANRFLAGALVPLWLFPEPLRILAEVLPFQTQAHIPLSIYMGRLTGEAALAGLATQALWVVMLYLLARWVWSRALYRVVVQGG